MTNFRFGVFHCSPVMGSPRPVVDMLCPECGRHVESDSFLLAVKEDQLMGFVPCLECGSHVNLMRFDGATIKPVQSSRQESTTSTPIPKADF